jgi:prophage maintenance system killer protein
MQAAVLAHGIPEGQFFIDGNKRLALVAMLTLLEVRGVAMKRAALSLLLVLGAARAHDHEHLARRQRRATRLRQTRHAGFAKGKTIRY